jgi:PIN domain nuclease of toxin-antitoxin system
MSEYVLDSSALLAVMHEESGADVVEKILDRCVVSAVNLSETIGKLAIAGAPPHDALDVVSDMVQSIIPFNTDIALIAGRLTPHARSLGLSFGDRACLATAEYLNMEAVTADKVWNKLKGAVKVKVIR